MLGEEAHLLLEGAPVTAQSVSAHGLGARLTRNYHRRGGAFLTGGSAAALAKAITAPAIEGAGGGGNGR
jgi:hypothetical protein